MSQRVEPVEPNVIAETENFVVWYSEEDEDVVYHIELGGITLHVSSEEWDEFVVLVKSADLVD
ncbi:MAG: hypothetical protein M9928_12875 [Anaerolineae bacterium]|nr:hypothetical protein [Anaerolineae bacterium]MCO5188442.1 hypothetical protein [Anaerolineae bacterium]MCO5192947.1 hypothetical protein [Anaerolineae bacterium]MCO5198471.1 hypothetical protein [Anaerolineae bacterium]MCO5205923.1 hypothetical protein [Anaerolineae bacterium]